MFPISHRSKDGKLTTHEIKPLQVIWSKMPHYSAINTLHIDDLSRNFAMNPLNGVKIKDFKNVNTTKATDKELLYLKQYLMNIADAKDVTTIKHKKWRDSVTDQ